MQSGEADSENSKDKIAMYDIGESGADLIE